MHVSTCCGDATKWGMSRAKMNFEGWIGFEHRGLMGIGQSRLRVLCGQNHCEGKTGKILA